MTVTFQDDNSIVIYALGKILCFARQNQYIFVADCIWWIAALVGINEGQASYIDSLHHQRHIEVPEVFGSLHDSQCDLIYESTKSVHERRPSPEVSYVHLDSVPNIQATNSDVSDLELDNSEEKREDSILASAIQFIHLSWKQRNALWQQEGDSLSRTRSGKIVKP
jgi:hypothetical protein